MLEYQCIPYLAQTLTRFEDPEAMYASSELKHTVLREDRNRYFLQQTHQLLERRNWRGGWKDGGQEGERREEEGGGGKGRRNLRGGQGMEGWKGRDKGGFRQEGKKGEGRRENLMSDLWPGLVMVEWREEVTGCEGGVSTCNSRLLF